MRRIASRNWTWRAMLLGVAALTGVLYYFCVYSAVNERVIVAPALYTSYSSAQELYEQADLVVIGATNQRFLERKQVRHAAEALQSDFYTLTTIAVDKVIKGQLAGSNLDIGEPVTYSQSLGGISKITRPNYRELQRGSKYLLFLKKNNEGCYVVMSAGLGKYNVDETDPEPDSNALKQQLRQELWEDSRYLAAADILM